MWVIMISTVSVEAKVKFLRGVADKTRLGILQAIRSEEKTVNGIVACVGGSQSNISQHLACLRGCGVITKRQEGKFCYYGLANSNIIDFLSMVDTVMEDICDDVTCCTMNATLLGDTINDH